MRTTGYKPITITIVVCLLALCVAATDARADSIATDSGHGCTWTSTLSPYPAIQVDSCSWMTNALTSHGYTADNGWTITTGASLAGSITVSEYYAWVTTAPTENLGGTAFGGYGTFSCWGGATLRLNYTAGTGDPTGTDVHWIQVISTNCPSAYGSTNGYHAGAGFYEYIDNATTAMHDPFYDHNAGGPANATEFLDIPSRACPDAICPCSDTCYWQAQVFLATGDLSSKNLTLYEDGWWWGFNMTCVPEPGTCALVAFGFVFLAYRRRR